MTYGSLVTAVRQWLHPKPIFSNRGRLLDAEDLFLEAFSAWTYSSLGVASVDLLAAQSFVRFIKRWGNYQQSSIYNLLCSLRWTLRSILLSWLLLSARKSLLPAVSPVSLTITFDIISKSLVTRLLAFETSL